MGRRSGPSPPFCLVSVLLSAAVKRVGVSRMRDFKFYTSLACSGLFLVMEKSPEQAESEVYAQLRNVSTHPFMHILKSYMLEKSYT